MFRAALLRVEADEPAGRAGARPILLVCCSLGASAAKAPARSLTLFTMQPGMNAWP
jgi:hypothetical protein